jgi:hypothetical protein
LRSLNEANVQDGIADCTSSVRNAFPNFSTGEHGSGSHHDGAAARRIRLWPPAQQALAAARQKTSHFYPKLELAR